MLLSMTGHGHAVGLLDGYLVHLEIRSVNNRFLKTSVFGDLSAAIQSNIEDQVRGTLKRGSVSVRVQVQAQGDRDQYRINAVALTAYRDQLQALYPGEAIPLPALLSLPGVCEIPQAAEFGEDQWPQLKSMVSEAIASLNEMRRREGAAMLVNLLENCQQLLAATGEVERAAPRLAESYAARLNDKINALLEKYKIQAQPVDVIREIGIFAERADVAEELLRLRSHLVQFQEICESNESNGRKLDFLIQEILRETNTIGSKVSDSGIAQCVVEMKSVIERMREVIQNVE